MGEIREATPNLSTTPASRVTNGHLMSSPVRSVQCTLRVLHVIGILNMELSSHAVFLPSPPSIDLKECLRVLVFNAALLLIWNPCHSKRSVEMGPCCEVFWSYCALHCPETIVCTGYEAMTCVARTRFPRNVCLLWINVQYILEIILLFSLHERQRHKLRQTETQGPSVWCYLGRWWTMQTMGMPRDWVMVSALGRVAGMLVRISAPILMCLSFSPGSAFDLFSC